jgi:polysaccharide pyruvyl transferase WcaK-like protein
MKNIDLSILRPENNAIGYIINKKGHLMFTLRKRQKKVIYHAGAWQGNFGDSIIHKSIHSSLSQCSKYKTEFRNINCQQTEFTKDLIEEINKEGDLLVIGGGGLIFYRPQDNSKSGWQWNIDIDLIETIKVPFVVYAIGYNQFEYDNSNFIPVTNSHLQKTVKLSTLFSVRDTGTKRELIARGCDENKIEVIPDSGMFLPADNIKVPGLRHDMLKVGINWTSDREKQTFPEPWAQNRDRFINSLAELCHQLINKRNAQIFYISHMGINFDKRIADSLRELLGGNLIVIAEVLSHIFPANYEKAEKLVGVYRQMDIVLGMRGHANIVSFGQHVPFIPFGSHRKNRYLLEDIGESQYYIDVRKPELCTKERMLSLVEELLNERNSYMERHKRVYAMMREKFDSFNSRVLSLIDKQYKK